MSEEIIGRINGMQRSDGKVYNLIFTSNRMIGEFVGGSGGVVTATTFGLAGVIGKAVAESHLQKKANQMDEIKTPDEILASHKHCFEIINIDIERVQVKKGLLESSLHIVLNQKIPKLGKALFFSFPKKRMDDVEPVISQVFREKAVINK